MSRHVWWSSQLRHLLMIGRPLYIPEHAVVHACAETVRLQRCETHCLSVMSKTHLVVPSCAFERSHAAHDSSVLRVSDTIMLYTRCRTKYLLYTGHPVLATVLHGSVLARFTVHRRHVSQAIQQTVSVTKLSELQLAHQYLDPNGQRPNVASRVF